MLTTTTQPQLPLQTILDRFLKWLKQSQQTSRPLMETLDSIANRNHLQNCIFVNEQITKCRQLGQYQRMQHDKHALRMQSIVKAWGTRAEDQDNIKLLKRVVFRAFQLMQSAVVQYKCGGLNKSIESIKDSCQKMINSTQNTDKVKQVMLCIHKALNIQTLFYLKLLDRIVQALQNGDNSLLQNMKKQFNSLSPFAAHQRAQSNAQITQRNNSKVKNKEDNDRPKSKPKTAKQQLQEGDLRRNLHNKKIRKIVDNMKDVLQFKNQDFIESVVSWYNVQHNKEQMIKDMLARNKYNAKQINQFRLKEKKMQNKFKHQQQKQQKIVTQKHNYSESELKPRSDMSQAKIELSTRASLLLKMRHNSQQRKNMPSSLLHRNVNKQIVKSRLRSSLPKEQLKQALLLQKQKKNMMRVLQGVITANQSVSLKVMAQNVLSYKQKLPSLSKRAHSVDRNYQKNNQNIDMMTIQPSLQNSNSELKRRSRVNDGLRMEQEIKGLGNQLSNFNNRLMKVSDQYRHLCF